MSNVSLQKRLGVSAATVSRILAGHRVGSPEFILKVADLSPNADAGLTLRAAVRARAGDPKDWIEIVRSTVAEPEAVPDAVDGPVS